ncbi:regulatory protein, MarR [Methanococcus vannielii SB]|jgi:DNA-binding transcriptional regulator GbsR (MarR family)|uniref:Regulatory protein, MarR n=1 Tax=Methanococcus vannielii (strain ATCC 35089 / DSM 1224 / JCM 13029 / OCM 148 / SB) TaxID=406327 RepID=A6USI2_METVS|nr:MarR family transcriptional regulator [Methanococcus vannielii]ABR55454.1 regulatory protein, MarR [Methanococcus vannielii SB]
MVKRYLKEEDAFIEQFGNFFESNGSVPRIAGRILAYLLICDPPYQNSKQLVERLNISKSSVSNMITLLTRAKLVKQMNFPGQRERYYYIEEKCFETLLLTQFDTVSNLRIILKEGKALLENKTPELSNRIGEMDKMYEFLEIEMPELLKKYQNFCKKHE